MENLKRKPAVLLLEDGAVFHGNLIGCEGTSVGEIAFNTGMTGYQEVFTDPSYFGQILVMTTSHIGNYGVHEGEIESDQINIAGLVCKKFSENFSRTAADGTLQQYFEKNTLTGISDVDTRALVRHIRDKGAMNAIISSEELDVNILMDQLKDVPSMDGLELSSRVSTKEAYEIGDPDAPIRVSLLDLGVKKNIVRCLADRGCRIKVFPYDSSFSDLKSFDPDGIMLSNGPGDPSAMPEVIKTVKEVIDSEIPTFGICLGHQILALSQGLGTMKMHNGHRGINHPVKNMISGKGEVTSQNHGFVVKMDDAEKREDIEVSHVHLNDNTLAGLKLKGKKAFSVQYHPEASPGPHDSRYLFDEFVAMMKVGKESPVA